LSLSLRFSHRNPVHDSPLPHTRYMPRLPHSSHFIARTIVGEEYRSFKLLIKFSPLPCHLVPLRPKYSPQHAAVNFN
jgi:hypothetical protein